MAVFLDKFVQQVSGQLCLHAPVPAVVEHRTQLIAYSGLKSLSALFCGSAFQFKECI